MKIEFIFIGKTTEPYLNEGITTYLKRLVNYLPAEILTIPASSSRLREKIIEEESRAILSKIQPRDFIVLLDERGKELTSRQLAAFIEKQMVAGTNRLLMITGGAYGVSDEVKQKVHYTLSASKFTFTHQMIRLLLTEQVYRAMTILKNESYHHD
ncbi:MAG: 23S rRNA (pseudouridine(1915)-N(3))-methyltransferase RlmH [Bacteroidia bacterium]|jgi:23S rRNA (pseudouridine1915-N3)-methyltransferase|nr:23S rRNA (pseudouridine(1915)-N(3))-methyltransferase RlmH [Bacteroidota bacterium]MBP9788982.1 23S rRNA (pseudouridine(1915)-N(3))-methyltransferase RlmH [Bacteroidia bacterium]MBK7430404.1 23S rRNA (pseudouridine(1915)-N(3))-methyltransferase RlmH [Bacteroidota bacterium]MBK7573562.1 23S rRNA (pseudouridine(1915)-N(3))-methyltransferase RlmH [Bacteroidota bacterium]MBK8585276.1 23S rRNA (pseudouridine(1915)-N(3))-methyltransferase RlmH [Bacteroidota bacterium]